jgi:hypothetical protein
LTNHETARAFLTLGVDDLERSLLFYRDGLGFTTKGIVGTWLKVSRLWIGSLNRRADLEPPL